jgi:glycosyltransferase involved in cell wall biosynthesis
MKVAYLMDSVSRKSAGLFEICRRLAQTSCNKDEITVLGIEDEHTNADINEWAPLRPKIFHIVGPRNFGYAPGYAQALASAAPDIVHVHGLWTYHSLAGYLWHRRTNRPLMYSAHGMLDPWALRNAQWKKRLIRALWEDAAHRRAACFHVNSEAEHLTLRRYGMRNPVCVIPNGIDLPERIQSLGFGAQDSELMSIARGRKVLLYLGRLHPKKNLVPLLRAWAAAEKSGVGSPDSERWLLAIAGWSQGGYEGKLKQLANELGLSFLEVSGRQSAVRTQWSEEITANTAATTALTSIAFLGPQFGADKDACYRTCDAFILPSLSEGLPMTVLEAWAYGKPVLMTPECNLPEGFAVGAALQIGTGSEEIAAGLKQLTEMDDDDRKAMGARGRGLVAETFSWPRIGEQMRSVYEWVVGGGTAPETITLWQRRARR